MAIAIIIAINLMIAMLLFYDDIFNHKKDSDLIDEKIESDKSLEIVKIYNSEARLLFTYKDVYLQRFDKNIYNLYTSYNGKHIIKLDLGSNMLLTSQNVEDEKLLLKYKG